MPDRRLTPRTYSMQGPNRRHESLYRIFPFNPEIPIKKFRIIAFQGLVVR